MDRYVEGDKEEKGKEKGEKGKGEMEMYGGEDGMDDMYGGEDEIDMYGEYGMEDFGGMDDGFGGMGNDIQNIDPNIESESIG